MIRFINNNYYFGTLSKVTLYNIVLIILIIACFTDEAIVRRRNHKRHRNTKQNGKEGHRQNSHKHIMEKSLKFDGINDGMEDEAVGRQMFDKNKRLEKFSFGRSGNLNDGRQDDNAANDNNNDSAGNDDDNNDDDALDDGDGDNDDAVNQDNDNRQGQGDPQDGQDESLITIPPTLSPEEEEELKEEEIAKEKEKLMFNLIDERESWQTGYINHSTVEHRCKNAIPCLASQLVLPVCGTDAESYLNSGVLRCAQKCNQTMYEYQAGPCEDYALPPMPAKTTVAPPVTPEPKHTTANTRFKIRGILVEPIFSLLGLHTHDDGGVYLADEKKNTAWWNF